MNSKLRTLVPLLCAALAAMAAPPAAAAEQLRLGAVAQYFPFSFYEQGTSTRSGFDIALGDSLCEAMKEAGSVTNCTWVVLQGLADRIPALQNGTIDVLISVLSVTPDREEMVDMVRPPYYASGAGLFALSQKAAEITSWDSLRGKKLCTESGYYANAQVAADYGVTLVEAAGEEALGDALVAGLCDAGMADSVSLGVVRTAQLKHGAAVKAVPGVPPLYPEPYAIAVAKGRLDLQDRLSGALVRALLTPGRNASIFGIEETFIIDNGGQPLRSLPPLTNSVTYGWPTIWRR